MDTAFWILSCITVLGALLAISLRNLVHCVLSLILFFLGIAGHYFLLRAEFLGVVQILIYIGAVAVLILFAIMLTRNVTGQEHPQESLGGKWWMGVLTGILVAGGVLWTLAKEPGLSLSPSGTPQAAVADLGKLLVGEAVVPLEVMAVLLTAALIGAVVIALEEVIRRR